MLYAKFCMHSQLLFFRSCLQNRFSFLQWFFNFELLKKWVNKINMSKSLINARVASGGWVAMGQGATTAITPQGGRTPTGLPTSNPNTSPSPPLRHPSHWGQKPSGSKMNKPLKQRGKKTGTEGDPKPKKRREGGQPKETLRYYNATPC